jgi:hypothetical protein
MEAYDNDLKLFTDKYDYYNGLLFNEDNERKKHLCNCFYDKR